MAKGFACHRRGHRPMDGWSSGPQVNDAGHAFLPRVCRDCHCAYIEFIGAHEISPLVDVGGNQILTES